MSVSKFPTRLREIPGTTIFGQPAGRKGATRAEQDVLLFNDAANREAFQADEDAYCARYGLNPEQREAIRAKNVLQLIAAGGNVYPRPFAGIFGLDVQDLGAQQTGMTKDEFRPGSGRRREELTMATSSVASPPRIVPAGPCDRPRQADPYWGDRPVHGGWPGGRRRHLLQRPRPELLPQ